jgi:hypothetical protein
LYTLGLTCSIFSSTNECSTTQSNWTFIECPYLATTIEHPIIFFFFSYQQKQQPIPRNVTPHQWPHANKCAMGWIYHMLPKKMKKCYFNGIDFKHNFLLNPKWKWHLLKALTFRIRYNNQHAHPNVGYSCKTRENMP